MKVLLLRGINVGGTGKLPMADLRAILARLGARDVQTYIQSGNVVFSGDVEENALGDAIETDFAFRPRIMIFPADHLHRVARDNPFDFEPGLLFRMVLERTR